MVRCITCNVLHMRQFCRFLYCLAWFDTVEFNRLPYPKNEMYDDAVFANRFHNQLAMFGIGVLIWLSRFFHAHIAYVIDTDKIIAAFFGIFLLFAWFDTLEFNRLPWWNMLDLIRLNSIVCHDQTPRYTMMQFSPIDSAIIWLCLECVYWYGYLDSLLLILRMK